MLTLWSTLTDVPSDTVISMRLPDSALEQTLPPSLLWIYLVSRLVREREMFYLTTHSTHFIYGYMASDIWLRTILIVRKETRCRHIGYSYRLTARVLLYAPSHRQDSTVTPVVEHWLEREISRLVYPTLTLNTIDVSKGVRSWCDGVDPLNYF